MPAGFAVGTTALGQAGIAVEVSASTELLQGSTL
jgi:hypothetical protein